MTREELLTKPFTVAGFTVTPRMIGAVLSLLTEAQAFQSSNVAGALYHAGVPDWHQASEAANRMRQRFRKLGLVHFKHAHWWPIPSAIRSLPATGEVGRG